MSLSLEQANHLRNNFHQLAELTADKEGLEQLKDVLIEFCILNELELYNLASLQTAFASKLLDALIHLFTEGSNSTEEGIVDWIKQFKEALDSANELKELHYKADISVKAQYLRTGALLSNTLLTMKDLTDLLPSESDAIKLFNPLSLTEHSREQNQALNQWMYTHRNATLFIPVVHDGHWFYVLKNEGLWSIQDSQPIKNALSPRQQAIHQACQNLLGEELPYESTGAQDNDFACGTHVINAYRVMSNPDYALQSHEDILYEALTKQAVNESLPSKEALFPKAVALRLSEKEKHIIKTTASTQGAEDKAERYSQHLEELILVSKQGLFAKVKNKIALAEINSAKADANESDKAFATRLQEAELRIAGL